ncbi:MAG: STAS domain-containing protein [Planctomycetota bacterium]|jgi:anti-anti-sigma factor
MSDSNLNQEELDNLLSEWSAEEDDNSAEGQVQGEVLAGDILLIHVSGHSISADTSALISRVCDLMSEVEGNVVLELKECTYLSSVGLGAIAELAVETQRKGFGVVVASANEKIKFLINLLDLGELLGIFDSVDEAVASFKK